MAFDPCNPVPGSEIPVGLHNGPRKFAPHHVVGRLHRKPHHKFVHAGPPPNPAPNPAGCEKHAFPKKFAALGGALGGLTSSVPPPHPSFPVVPPPIVPPPPPPVVPPPIITPPPISPPPITPPPTNVPEPSSIVIFAMAVIVALMARYAVRHGWVRRAA